MVKVAQVIVDIPLMQTDKPFSYLIPEHLQVGVGVRVHVPFGKGNRLLQGFVIAIKDEKVDGLKEIAEVLDFEPVLNEEQLNLAKMMRKTVFSYQISLLKAMLPNLLNSTYDKLLTPNSEDQAVRALFKDNNQIKFSEVPKEQKSEISSWVRSGKVNVTYLANDKKNIKTEKYYQVNHAILKNLDISSRAKKRQQLRDYLLTQHNIALLKQLYTKYSRDVVAYFQENGAIEITEVAINRSAAYFESIEEEDFLILNEEQQSAVQLILSEQKKNGKPVLLEGVTGSGKTEVYLHVIDNVLKDGKTAIVLVPEISLTPLITQRFVSRFGDQVAILHSGLSDGEKYDEWRKIKNKTAKVVVGARSAIFAPLENIGAIIIDEEHEASYKQETSPRYHARDVALIRAKTHGASLVLGSATPSIESRARAGKGVYAHAFLTKRANPLAKLATVSIVDFRDYIGQQEFSNFTPPLLEKIAERLSNNEQIVLLLNRRGYSSFMLCRDCGEVDNCPNCDISLTLHMATKKMACHYCAYEKEIPNHCPNCGSTSIRYYGTGTQKAYDELQEAFPDARILRMDVDTTRKKGSHEKILETFGSGRADILLGTQMIAKGLDFPNVTLVGVLNADTALHLPDFRASERTFQLLTQVAGRAGRGEKTGEVLIQTYNPNHYAILFAKNQNYEAFYRYEMGIRHQMNYPPYYYTVGITLSHKDEEVVLRKSYDVLTQLQQQLSDKAQFLGPAPKPIARTHNLYHYQIIVKYRFEDQLENTLNMILDWGQLPENKDLRVMIDYEPQNFV